MHHPASRFSEPWGRAAKSMLDSMLRISEVGLEVQERLAAQQLRTLEAHFDAGFWHRSTLGQPSVPGSLSPSLESIAEVADQLTASTQDLIDVQLQMQDSLLDCVEDMIDGLTGAPATALTAATQ